MSSYCQEHEKSCGPAAAISEEDLQTEPQYADRAPTTSRAEDTLRRKVETPKKEEEEQKH